ncbi:hypothetical protein N7520_007537 [Penicillium odoratum]|uniref:uncharacterized protein n=1 Tax=Penicillium odoratum TaxID=1167516 RepID=UPI002549A503|nr:uncharacterized protein N7520_007537 [Penicillium odoratum]KAJ5760381.1 hypothetical protein N7520_007537 [Penicillium odoratum]
MNLLNALLASLSIENTRSRTLNTGGGRGSPRIQDNLRLTSAQPGIPRYCYPTPTEYESVHLVFSPPNTYGETLPPTLEEAGPRPESFQITVVVNPCVFIFDRELQDDD